MNHLNPQFPSPSDTLGMDSSLVPDSPNVFTWLTLRPSRIIVQDAMQEDLIGRCEAQLAYNTMERVALLSEMEVQLSKDNPYAAGRFKAIANAYTMRALQRMTGGGLNGR